MKLPGRLSLKQTLFLYFLSASTLFFVVLGVTVYTVADRVILEGAKEAQLLLLENQLQIADYGFSRLENLILWLSSDRGLYELMQRKPEELRPYDSVRRSFYSSLESRLLPFDGYINLLNLRGENGFLVRKGSDAYLINPEQYEEDDWYKAFRQTRGEITWWPLRENHTRVSPAGRRYYSVYVMPATKKLYRLDDNTYLGDLILFLSPTYFLGTENLQTETGNTISYLVDREGKVLLTNRLPAAASPDFRMPETISEVIPFDPGLCSASSAFLEVREDQLVMYRRCQNVDFYLIRITRMESAVRERRGLLTTMGVIMGLLVLLSVLLSMALASSFTRPIADLIRKINHLAKGEFGYRLETLPSGELGLLNESLDIMSADVQSLMAERQRQTEEKRELEIRLLQLQINPHFLFNTLSTIRWMASFQGAKGIETMVASLGEILEAVCNGTEEELPLAAELNFIEHYYQIQKVRYRDKVSLSIRCEDPALLRAGLPRFTLQPIVENAIFHGIEPGVATGVVALAIRREGEDVIISVRDDGVGIPPEKLAGILEGAGEVLSHRGIKGIGLANIHTKLRLTYGDGYGLEVDSVAGEFTDVRVRLPYHPIPEGGDAFEGPDCR